MQSELELASEQMYALFSEVKIIFAGADSMLYTFPLKQLDAMWDNSVRLLQRRAGVIAALQQKLDKIELERISQISELFKHYHKLYKDIAYLSNKDIDAVMDKEVYNSNVILLSNYKHHTQLIAQLKLENVIMLKSWRITWEGKLAMWRDLHIKDTIDKFVSFMRTPDITDCPEMKHMLQKRLAEIEGLEKRRATKVQSLTSLKPPKLKETDVLNWFEETCALSQELENINTKYLNQLHSLRGQMTLDCESVITRMLGSLITEGVTSPSEAETLKCLYFMPHVESWNKSNYGKVVELDELFVEREAEFKSNLQSLFHFHRKGAIIWSSHEIGINSMNTELTDRVKVCRNKHDDINQQLESSLDILLDKMRQDTAEIELDQHFEYAKSSLDIISSAYNNFQDEMSEVIKSYPKMIFDKLELYSTQIKVHVGVLKVSSMTVIREETEEELKQVENSFELEDETDKDDIYDEREENESVKESVFITESVSMPDAITKISDGFTLFYVGKVAQEAVEIYLHHLDVLTTEVMENTKITVEERLCELKSEIELRHHIHKPRVLRMKLDIYNVRLNELKNHEERIKQHSAGITLEVSILKDMFKELSLKHSKNGKIFKELVDGCMNSLPTLEKATHLTGLQTRVNLANNEHINNIKHDLSMFRNRMEEKLNDLRESNQSFGLAFKPFSEGGNFGPDEIDKYRKVLEKCNNKIDNCETYILTEIDGMESKCLDAATDVTNAFDAKYKLHIFEVTFLEKINSWMSNCQVKIKTEVAASNRNSKNLKKSVGDLKTLIDSCARPHPDKPKVQAEEILEHIPYIYNMISERIKYLDCSKHSSQPAVKIAEHASPIPVETTNEDETPTYFSTVNLTKSIIKMSKKKGNRSADTESDDKKRVIEINYEWFMSNHDKQEKIIIPKRSKVRSDASDKQNKRTGSASSRSSLMSVVLKDVQSFMPIVKKILQETQSALYLASESYYSQSFSPSLRTSMADSLELCMDSLNKRLNNYYIQADEYYNKCIEDLREVIIDVTNAYIEIPPLIFDDILEKSVTDVTQKTANVKLLFEKNSVKINERKENNKVLLKPILGHPNNQVDLNNLCRREEDRSLHAAEILSEFINDLRNIELASARQFTDNINDCACRMSHLFDELITIDDVMISRRPDKRLPPSVILKRQHVTQNSSGDLNTSYVEPGRVISLLNFSELCGRPFSAGNERSDCIRSLKYTPVHEVVVRSMRDIYHEFKTRFDVVTEEIKGIQKRWEDNEAKWKAQWVQSVRSVQDLYAPHS